MKLECEPIYRLRKLNEVIREWINYYVLGSIKGVSEDRRAPENDDNPKSVEGAEQSKMGIKEDGINKVLVRLISSCRKPYQKVAMKTCVVRTTNKKTDKRGFVSCLDCYSKCRRILDLD